jgi:hypothetical protein
MRLTLKKRFRKLCVRTLDLEAKALADRYFFETLVRLYRAGEGAAYKGLKPAGRDLGAAKRENQVTYTHFAEKLTLHMQTEEEAFYPTAILIGEYLHLKLNT